MVATMEGTDVRGRRVTTTWVSKTRTIDGEGRTAVELSAHHDKNRKKIIVALHLVTVDGDGWRKMLIGRNRDGVSTYMGLAVIPVARYSEKTMLELHDRYLAEVDGVLGAGMPSSLVPADAVDAMRRWLA